MSAALRYDQKLMKAIIPTFTAGCRRLTPGPGYLESLTESNVTVVTNKIVQVHPHGVELDTGEVIEVDAIVCATGFDVSFRPRFPTIGRQGNLQDIWSKELPAAYLSCAVAHMPNYFSENRSPSYGYLKADSELLQCSWVPIPLLVTAVS